MKITALLPGFQHLGTNPFPAHLCTIPNDRESDVRDSSDGDYHLVVAVDGRFDCDGSLRKMKPYTSLDEGVRCFGWVDRDGNFISHGENPVIPNDHAKVVAWRPCSQDFDLRT